MLTHEMVVDAVSTRTLVECDHWSDKLAVPLGFKMIWSMKE